MYRDSKCKVVGEKLVKIKCVCSFSSMINVWRIKTFDKKGVIAYDFLDIWETCANSRGMNYSLELKKSLADVSVQGPCKHSGGLKKGNFKNSSIGIKTHEIADQILL